MFNKEFSESFIFIHEERKLNMTRKIYAAVLAVIAAVVFCGQVSAAQNADIVFFIDSSSSMQDEIDDVKTNLAAFSRSLASGDISARFAVVEYREDKGVVAYRPDGTNIWTSDTSQVEAVLSMIDADNYDSDSLEAINEIFNWTGSQDFRADASRFGFMLTDMIKLSNDIHLFNRDSTTSLDIAKINTLMTGTISKLNGIDMRMSVISTPSLRSAYQNLYSQTGGAFIDITASDYYRSMLDMAQWISEEATTEAPLPHAIIEPVPNEVLNYVSEEGETVLQRIAKLANISVDQINVVTTANLHLSLPHEPTEAMKQKADGEFIAKIDTITFSSDRVPSGSEGYFLFQLNIPDEVLSMDLKVSELKLWYATPDEFSSSGIAGAFRAFFRAAFDPFTYMEITDVFGIKADTLSKKVLILVFCNAGESLSMWLLKHVLMLLLGGCSSLWAGSVGMVSIFAAGSALLLGKIFMKR